MQIDHTALDPLKNAFVSGGLVLMAVGAVAAWARRAPLEVWNWVLCRLTVTADVLSTDPVFRYLSLWLHQQPYAHVARRLAISSRRGIATDERDLIVTPSTGTHFFWWGRRPVWLTRIRESGTKDGDQKEHITIRVLGRSQGTVRTIFEQARSLSADRERDRPRIWVANSNEYWSDVCPLPHRPLSSVILPVEDIERVVGAIRQFLDEHDWYAARAIAWNLGCLFHGLPGSGKTSLIAAIAYEFQLSIYVLNLSAVRSDSTLTTLLGFVPSRSILVFEDFDAATAARERSQKSETSEALESFAGVTLAGVLNATNGLGAREGLIKIFSTNHLDTVDPALIRPGRADVWIRFTYATADQAERIYRRFYDDAVPVDDARAFGVAVAAMQVTMAEIQQHLMVHRSKPKTALATVDRIGSDRREHGGEFEKRKPAVGRESSQPPKLQPVARVGSGGSYTPIPL